MFPNGAPGCPTSCLSTSDHLEAPSVLCSKLELQRRLAAGLDHLGKSRVTGGTKASEGKVHSDPAVLPEWPREPLTQTSGLRMTLPALDLGTGGVASHCRSRPKFGIGRNRSRAGPAHAGFKTIPL